MVDNTTVDDSQGNCEAEATTMEQNNKRNNHKMNIGVSEKERVSERECDTYLSEHLKYSIVSVILTPSSNIQQNNTERKSDFHSNIIGWNEDLKIITRKSQKKT